MWQRFWCDAVRKLHRWKIWWRESFSREFAMYANVCHFFSCFFFFVSSFLSLSLVQFSKLAIVRQLFFPSFFFSFIANRYTTRTRTSRFYCSAFNILIVVALLTVSLGVSTLPFRRTEHFLEAHNLVCKFCVDKHPAATHNATGKWGKKERKTTTKFE